MTPEQFKRVEDLFDEARKLPTVQHGTFLNSRCPDDSVVREKVEQLLAHLDGPPLVTAGLARVFLFSDLVGSTELKQRHGDDRAAALIAEHDRLVRQLLKSYDGHEEVNPGDEFFATFERPSKATRFALALMQGLRSAEGHEPLRVRIGIHLGEITQVKTSDTGQRKLLGLAVDTAARVMSLAMPGQILLTRHVYDSIRQHVLTAPDGTSVDWVAHGLFAFKGVTEPLEVFEIRLKGFSPLTAPAGSEKARRVTVPEARASAQPAVDVEPGLHSPFGPTPSAARVSFGAEPRQIGPYRILERLGEGGLGVVYLAEQHKPIQRRVAIKLIKVGMDSKQVIARFDTERQALALMNHPNVAKVFDGGTTEQGRPYFVMEHVPGIPITKYCDKHRLSTEDRLRLFVDVCHAVQHAHQKGIIHRDIKPGNVLVAVPTDVPNPPLAKGVQSGIVKVIDFGVAKATDRRLTENTMFTEMGQLIGTPGYMSPEQAEMTALDIDTRTDIYSLGVLLYELLTGDLPFDSKELLRAGLAEIQRIIREIDPPKPSTRFTDRGADSTTVAHLRGTEAKSLARTLRGDLDWIVMKCLEKDRTRRYDTANGLAMEVQRYLNSEPILAGPPSVTYRARKFVRRHRALVMGSSVTAIAIIAGIVGTVIFARKASLHEQAAMTAHVELLDGLRSYAVESGERRHWETAEEAYQRAIKMAPARGDLRVDLCRLYVEWQKSLTGNEKTQRWNQAIALCEEGLKSEPDDDFGFHNLSIAYRELGRLTEAIEAQKRAVQLNPSFSRWVNLGTLHAMTDDVAEAKRCVTESTRLASAVTDRNHKPYTVWPWRSLAILQHFEGDGTALDSVQRAVDADPGDYPSYLIRARIRLARGDIPQALDDLIVADNRAEGRDPIVKRYLAHASMRSRRFEEAVKYSSDALKGGDMATANELILAIAEAGRGRADTAREHQRRAEATWPEKLKQPEDSTFSVTHGSGSYLWFEAASSLLELRDELGKTLGD